MTLTRLAFFELGLLAIIFTTNTSSQEKLKVSTSTQPVYSTWAHDYTCGGLRASMWNDQKGWHEADCLEIATRLSELRDVREVAVSTGPDVPSMLAYVQYGDEFKISQADFTAAQAQCRKIIKEGYAHPDVLKHCKTVAAGTIPYGLRLKP